VVAAVHPPVTKDGNQPILRVVEQFDSWPLPFCLVASLCVRPGDPRQERFAPPSGGGQAATPDSDHPAEASAAIRQKLILQTASFFDHCNIAGSVGGSSMAAWPPALGGAKRA
jgi:hypothetical protein